MELKDAVNIYHHICDTFVDDCAGCPFSEANIRCDLFDTSEVDEKEIAKWECVATEWWEHNKPVYPTVHNILDYMYDKMNGRLDVPITEELAKEFNIVPINERGLTKYERGEWAP